MPLLKNVEAAAVQEKLQNNNAIASEAEEMRKQIYNELSVLPSSSERPQSHELSVLPSSSERPLLQQQDLEVAPVEQHETAVLMKLCMDILNNNETCHNLYQIFKEERYVKLSWDITCKIFFERPFGIVIFVFWTVFLSVLNMVILFLCTLLKPLRSVLLNKIVSDLRRRYYFTSDSSELRVIDNNKK